MNRRQFVQTTAAAAAAAATGDALGSGPASGKRPNILFVFGDQHRWCSMPGEPFDLKAAVGKISNEVS
jgi:hypothetical protein